MTINTVDLTTLPEDILDQIPLSIQLKGPILELESLPLKIQYLIQHYLQQSITTVSYKTVYDTKPDVSVYNDLKIIKTKKELIREYFNNLLNVKVGSYPFDVKEGSSLKSHLQTLDTSLRQTLIGADVNKIVGVLGSDYDIGIEIREVQIIPVQEPVQDAFDKINEKIYISIRVTGEDETIDIES